MKHSVKITVILVSLFVIAQIVGIYVANVYKPVEVTAYNETSQEIQNETIHNIPYGFEPPQDIEPTSSVIQILISLALAVILILVLIKFKAEMVIRGWFFLVVIIGIALSLNAFLFSFPYSSLIAILLAVPLAFFKVFKRSIIAHNFTEVLIYPGIAAVFIPLLSIWSGVILLALISVYDIYAVWHAGFMQKMAKYQMEKVRVFSGFLIPYVRRPEFEQKSKEEVSASKKKVSVQVAILGGGDVVFPIIIAGIALHALGLYASLLVACGATLALSYLFYISEKGRFYPAMPFISVGCLLGLGIAYLI